MKNTIPLLVACVFVAGGLWLALHAKSITDATCFGYIAGMYGACSIRIGAEAP